MPRHYRDEKSSASALVSHLVDSMLDLFQGSSKMSPYAYDGDYRRPSQSRSTAGVWDGLFDRLGGDRRRRSEDSNSYRCPPTYGTYYAYSDGSLPTSSRRRSSCSSTRRTESSTCACTCCPHECWKHSGSRRRRSSEHAERPYDRHDTPPPPSPRRSSERADGRDRSSRSRSDGRGHSSRRHRAPATTTTISVHDYTDGPLWRCHGPVFPLTIPAQVTMRDLLNTLAPTGNEKVVVVWADGGREPLDKDVSLRELRKHALRLEVKAKKSVHWR